MKEAEWKTRDAGCKRDGRQCSPKAPPLCRMGRWPCGFSVGDFVGTAAEVAVAGSSAEVPLGPRSPEMERTTELMVSVMRGERPLASYGDCTESRSPTPPAASPALRQPKYDHRPTLRLSPLSSGSDRCDAAASRPCASHHAVGSACPPPPLP